MTNLRAAICKVIALGRGYPCEDVADQLANSLAGRPALSWPVHLKTTRRSGSSNDENEQADVS